MADKLLTLGRILLVKSPTSLPRDVEHEESIVQLSQTAEAVILFSHGDDKYFVSPEFQFPVNVHHIRYDYDTLTRDTIKLKEVLEGLGLVVRNRHLEATMPFILTGSIIALPAGKTLDFYDGKNNGEVGRVKVGSSRTTWTLDD